MKEIDNQKNNNNMIFIYLNKIDIHEFKFESYELDVKN